jgi:predicted TIM-barrel fold metal-dependent hydrolase
MEMKLIGLEEHFVTEDVLRAWRVLNPRWQDVALARSDVGHTRRRLVDINALRLEASDQTGLDIQVLSLTAPGVQNLPPDEAVSLQTASNNRVSDAIRAHPDRFQGFATLATPRPEAAAKELERGREEVGAQRRDAIWPDA